MSNLYNDIYNLVKLIPLGKVTTYGEIAKFLNKPHFARQVGWALHRNPDPQNIPCHRVVFADGSLSPGYAFGGQIKQFELLMGEGITFINNKVNLKKHLYKFI